MAVDVAVDGVYTATITFDSTAGPVDVPVVMQAGLELTSDAGFQYIRLLDPETFETVMQVSDRVTDGVYNFTFSDVPPGTYFLGSGADSDNDSSLCEIGEGCGGYPVLSRLTPIAVDRDLSELDFTANFLAPFRAPEPASGAVQIGALLTLAVLARRRWRRSE